MVSMSDPLTIEDTKLLVAALLRKDAEKRERDEKTDKANEGWFYGSDHK
jgi:hypothetical protein